MGCLRYGHEARLNEIAGKHGLRLLTGRFSPADYIGYAMDLALVGLGLLKPEEVNQPKDVFEEYRERTGQDWTKD